MTAGKVGFDDGTGHPLGLCCLPTCRHGCHMPSFQARTPARMQLGLLRGTPQCQAGTCTPPSKQGRTQDTTRNQPCQLETLIPSVPLPATIQHMQSRATAPHPGLWHILGSGREASKGSSLASPFAMCCSSPKLLSTPAPNALTLPPCLTTPNSTVYPAWGQPERC